MVRTALFVLLAAGAIVLPSSPAPGNYRPARATVYVYNNHGATVRVRLINLREIHTAEVPAGQYLKFSHNDARGWVLVAIDYEGTVVACRELTLASNEVYPADTNRRNQYRGNVDDLLNNCKQARWGRK
jgi:hypothetical protein